MWRCYNKWTIVKKIVIKIDEIINLGIIINSLKKLKKSRRCNQRRAWLNFKVSSERKSINENLIRSSLLSWIKIVKIIWRTA